MVLTVSFYLDPRVRPCHGASTSSLKFGTQQSRTFLSQLKRQTRTQKETAPSAASADVEAAKSSTSKETLRLTNLPYFVRRTPSNQLPVYLVTKAGGTKRQTKIQKTEGNLEALRADLSEALGPADVTINRLNGHILVKVRVANSTRAQQTQAQHLR